MGHIHVQRGNIKLGKRLLTCVGLDVGGGEELKGGGVIGTCVGYFLMNAFDLVR